MAADAEPAGWPAVVLPARDAAPLLPPALAAFVPAAVAAGGRVIVVDDASADATSEVARTGGAEVLRLDEPAGPYVARNAGWRHARDLGAELAVFVDARCRPRPGWLPTLLQAVTAPGAALAAGDVAVLARAHLAGRAAARLQPLSIEHGRAAAFLPYAPTCHLAAPIDVLEAVGGFRPVRGGGDVDLCWRVQLAGLGSIAWADDAVLDWEPRAGVRELLEQHRRYGANNARLCRAFAAEGCAVPAAPAPWRARLVGLRRLGGALATSPPSAWPELVVTEAARVAQAIGYARAVSEPAAELEAAAR